MGREEVERMDCELEGAAVVELADGHRRHGGTWRRWGARRGHPAAPGCMEASGGREVRWGGWRRRNAWGEEAGSAMWEGRDY